jgi:uncharacterized UPF0160 family protein
VKENDHGHNGFDERYFDHHYTQTFGDKYSFVYSMPGVCFD